MPQVLKEEVRRRIVTAALHSFVEHGFEGATLTDIARRADIATANLYRYYASKSELFEAVLPAELPRRFEALLEASVAALSPLAQGKTARSGAAGEDLLGFWGAHRLEVVILLDRARGSAYERFGEEFVERLVSLTISELHAAHPGLRVRATTRRLLVQLFENTRRTLAAILEANAGDAGLRESIEAFRSYQIAGLRGLVKWILQS